MMSRLDEAIFNAREMAVEEWTRENGEHFRSPLEGYGDLVRKLEKTMDSVKAFRKTLERVSDNLDNDDPRVLHTLLADMEVKGASAVYDATRMYASVRVMAAMVRGVHGGDLLDLLDTEVDPDA